MSSFEDLDLRPAVVDALAAEGVEIPTPFQEEAIPLLRRDNNLLGRAGPGAGTLVAYGAALLDRLEAGGGELRAVVLAPGRDRADGLASSLALLTRRTGHAVAALGGTWALPERADVLFASPADLLEAVRTSRIKLTTVQALVVDGAAVMHAQDELEALETLVGLVPSDTQRVVISLPVTDAVEDFVTRHVKRAVHVPPASASEADETIPHRGRLRYVVPDGSRKDAILAVVDRLLADEEARHVVVFFDSDDEAAEIGDRLTLHGYDAGAPGDRAVPVWLGVDDREVQGVLSDLDDASDVATVSFRVPAGPDSLDRRHGRGGPGLVLALGRELPHLRETARVAGYELDVGAQPRPTALASELDRFREQLEQALDTQDLAPHFLLLEPLAERYSAAEIAAAAVALLRSGPSPTAGDGREVEAAESAEETSAWVRLFISLGKKDDVGPGDILGAITGESAIDGDRVGRIEIKDTFCLVEVDQRVARKVIQAMNGITVKGRSIRVDYDRKNARSGGTGERGGSSSR